MVDPGKKMKGVRSIVAWGDGRIDPILDDGDLRRVYWSSSDAPRRRTDRCRFWSQWTTCLTVDLSSSNQNRLQNGKRMCSVVE